LSTKFPNKYTNSKLGQNEAMEMLERLNRLREQGAITEDEFTSKKVALLEQI